MKELIEFMEFHEYCTGGHKIVKKVKEWIEMDEVTRKRIAERVKEKKNGSS